MTARPLGPRLESCTLARRPGVLITAGGTSGPIDAELQASEERTAPALPYFLDPAGRLAETSRGNLFVPRRRRRLAYATQR